MILKIIKKIKLMLNPKDENHIIRTAFHEAGHYIVSILFKDKLFIKLLTANPDYVKSFDKDYTGGLEIEFYEIPEQYDYESGDKLILIYLAGICSQTIHLRGVKYVQENLAKFKNDVSLIVVDGAKVDYEEAVKFSRIIGEDYNLHYTKIIWSAFHLIFEFMLIPDVFESLQKVANEIIKSPEKTLKLEELNELYKTLNLENLISLHKVQILSQRYPLSKVNFENL